MNEKHIQNIKKRCYSYVVTSITLVILLVINLFVYFNKYYSYLLLSFAPLLGLILFIIYRARQCNLDHYDFYPSNHSAYNNTIYSIIFFIFYSLSIFSLLDGFYTYTVWYYISISICACTIATEILFTDTKYTWKSNLLMSILLFLNLSLSNQIVFPLQIGSMDSKYHIYIIYSIITQGVIPTGLTYTYFPMHHLLNAITSLVTGTSLFRIYYYLSSAVVSMSIVFIFLIGRKYINVRFGLLAALLFNCSDYLIYWARHPVHMCYNLFAFSVFFMIVLYILKNSNWKFVVLYIILSLNLVFLHHYSALIILSMFISIFIIEYAFKLEYDEYNMKSKGLFRLLFVILFTHWIFYSGIFIRFTGIIDAYINAFSLDISNSVASQTYYDKLPLELLFVNEIGSFILLVFASIGFFYFIIRNRSIYGYITSSLFVMFMLLIAVGTIIDVRYIMPYRIYAFLQMMAMVFLASASIVWIFQTETKKYVKCGIILTILVLQFFSASSTIAGYETSLFVGDQPYRKMYETPSERNCVIWLDGKINNTVLNKSFYSSPDLILSPETSLKVSTSVNIYPMWEKKGELYIDLTKVSNNSYLLFSIFSTKIGFKYDQTMDEGRIGSQNQFKMACINKQPLNNPITLRFYDNGIISVYKKQ